ncbi:MAG: RHS repeat protein [Alphaproteobacteria bacterium]|nr:RHS repeat protein [Alphaproteobacteria bacterium]
MKKTTKSLNDTAARDWVDDRTRRARRFVASSLLVLAGAFVPIEVGASASYSYDPVGRIAVARYDNGMCVIYIYDANGNRTSQTNASTGGPVTPTWGTGTFGCFVWSP